MGVIVMGLSVLSTQVIKTGLKTVFAEPRPFTVYLAEKTESMTDAFYHQDRSERAKLVDKFYSTQADTPAWLFFPIWTFYFCRHLANVSRRV